MPTCGRCEGDVSAKNAAGHYRDKCMSCIEEIAAEIPSHREQCEDDDCLVCTAP